MPSAKFYPEGLDPYRRGEATVWTLAGPEDIFTRMVAPPAEKSARLGYRTREVGGCVTMHFKARSESHPLQRKLRVVSIGPATALVVRQACTNQYVSHLRAIQWPDGDWAIFASSPDSNSDPCIAIIPDKDLIEHVQRHDHQ